MSMAVRHGSHYCMPLCSSCFSLLPSSSAAARFNHIKDMALTVRTREQREREREREIDIEACRCSTPAAAALPPRFATRRHTKACDRCMHISSDGLIIHAARKRKHKKIHKEIHIDQSKHQKKQQVIIMNNQERNPAEQQIDQNQTHQE